MVGLPASRLTRERLAEVLDGIAPCLPITFDRDVLVVAAKLIRDDGPKVEVCDAARGAEQWSEPVAEMFHGRCQLVAGRIGGGVSSEKIGNLWRVFWWIDNGQLHFVPGGYTDKQGGMQKALRALADSLGLRAEDRIWLGDLAAMPQREEGEKGGREAACYKTRCPNCNATRREKSNHVYPASCPRCQSARPYERISLPQCCSPCRCSHCNKGLATQPDAALDEAGDYIGFRRRLVVEEGVRTPEQVEAAIHKLWEEIHAPDEAAEAVSKRVVCFHHDDLDGEASAAIVRMHNGAECVAVGYKDPFPFEIVRNYEEVWIVDFSLLEDGWDELFTVISTLGVTWIDHHGSAIKRAENVPGVMELPGVRKEGVLAACELTWEFIYPGEAVPPAITCIALCDTHGHGYERSAMDFKVGLEATADTRPQIAWEGTWENLLKGPHGIGTAIQQFVDVYVWAGADIRRKRIITDAARVEKWAHPVSFWDGDNMLIGIAMNTDQYGSEQFASVTDKYDALIRYAHDGKQWEVTMYRAAGGDDYDLSVVAEGFGGGGHPGAAGFQCETLPWEQV